MKGSAGSMRPGSSQIRRDVRGCVRVCILSRTMPVTRPLLSLDPAATIADNIGVGRRSSDAIECSGLIEEKISQLG